LSAFAICHEASNVVFLGRPVSAKRI